MTLIYLTNYLNHHTRFLAEELYRLLGNDFFFVETENQHQSAPDFQMGYAFYFAQTGRETLYEWCLQAYDPAQTELCHELVDRSDVVIIGNAEETWLRRRRKKHKLTFLAHERWYRRGFPRKQLLKAYVGGWLHHRRFPEQYLLSTSAYTAMDAARIGCYRGKAYRWSYYPRPCSYTWQELTGLKCHEIPQILWAGRLIDWKHTEDAISACIKMNSEGYRFQLMIAGAGPEESRLKALCAEKGCTEIIRFLGVQTPEQVRNLMADSNIFLLTSDFQEGWGVVLNEAMGSGCAVVASHAAGATPYLVEHGTNGLIYQSGNVKDLETQLRELLRCPEKQIEYGFAAYTDIQTCWHPSEGAKRLIALSERLLQKQSADIYDSGPCSRAPLLGNDWWKAQNREV